MPDAMLLLLFQIGESFYAIDTDKVIEIVSMVVLSPIQSAPDYIAGALNYHGTIVPIIDLGQLFRGASCHPCYSTRIVIVNDRATATDVARSLPASRPFGLMAERVTETLRVSLDQVDAIASMSQTPYVSNVLMTERGMIQMLHWEHLIADALAALPRWEKEQGNGAGVN